MSNVIVLAIDGEAILLKNSVITPSLEIKDKDQSGHATSTATAEQGVKAKELKVSGLIPFSDKKTLSRLFELAEAKESGGRMKRYRVSCEVAQAIKFREATFSGTIDAAQQTDKMAWMVNFTLKEYRSVAEKRAMQASGKGTGAKAQTASGSASAEETPEQLDRVEQFLQGLNNRLSSMGVGPTSK